MKNFSPTGKVDDSALKKAVRPGSPLCHQRGGGVSRPNLRSRFSIRMSSGVRRGMVIVQPFCDQSYININVYIM